MRPSKHFPFLSSLSSLSHLFLLFLTFIHINLYTFSLTFLTEPNIQPKNQLFFSFPLLPYFSGFQAILQNNIYFFCYCVNQTKSCISTCNLFLLLPGSGILLKLAKNSVEVSFLAKYFSNSQQKLLTSEAHQETTRVRSKINKIKSWKIDPFLTKNEVENELESYKILSLETNIKHLHFSTRSWQYWIPLLSLWYFRAF